MGEEKENSWKNLADEYKKQAEKLIKDGEYHVFHPSQKYKKDFANAPYCFDCSFKDKKKPCEIITEGRFIDDPRFFNVKLCAKELETILQALKYYVNCEEDLDLEQRVFIMKLKDRIRG